MEYQVFTIEDPEYWDKDMWVSPKEVFVMPAPKREESVEEFLIRNTAIFDIDIFATDESALFKRLEQANSETKNYISALITSFQNSQKLPSVVPPRRVHTPYLQKYYRQEDAREEKYKIQIKENIRTLTHLQHYIERCNENIKAIREWTLEEKKKVLLQAENTILKILTIATILAFAVFIWLWVRERSDETWMEYVSTDEGLESVFSKICSNPEIKARTPPQFSHSEFINTLANKEAPRFLGRFLGKKLDSKHLGQIAAAQLSRLRERNTISQSSLPTVQTLYEIKADNLLQFSEVAKKQ